MITLNFKVNPTIHVVGVYTRGLVTAVCNCFTSKPVTERHRHVRPTLVPLLWDNTFLTMAAEEGVDCTRLEVGNNDAGPSGLL